MAWGVGRKAQVVAVASAIAMATFVGGAAADSQTTAIVTDPFPELKNPERCRGEHCGGGGERKIAGVVLDCSGRRKGAAHTLREAVKRVPVNGEILILGAPQGQTCIADGIVISKPMTIRSYDAVGSAYIEGTPGSFSENTPSFDSLKNEAKALQTASDELSKAASSASECTVGDSNPGLDKKLLALANEGRDKATLRHGYERADFARLQTAASDLKAGSGKVKAQLEKCESVPEDAKSSLTTFIAAVDGVSGGAPTKDGASCLEAQLPVGDALNIVGVNIVVRGGNVPCVRVRAGLVRVQRAKVDSRGTRWAFDVLESGRLVLEDSTIETDGGGVHARRATVDMRRVTIQLERGRRGIGATLLGADGVVSDLNVIGGEAGLIASSGSRGLIVERPVIADSGVGIEAVGQPGQGVVSIRGANIQRTIVGAWLRRNARVELLGGSIAQSERVGIFINNSGGVVRGMSHVDGGSYALAITTSKAVVDNSAKKPEKSSLCGDPLDIGAPDESDDGYGDQGGACDYMGDLGAALSGILGKDKVSMSTPSPLGAIDIDQNTLGPANTAVIHLAVAAKENNAQQIRITNNLLDCGKAACISGLQRSDLIENRGNRCTSTGWLGGSCR